MIDNTDVFFRLAQAAVKGVVVPEGLMPRPRTVKTKPATDPAKATPAGSKP